MSKEPLRRLRAQCLPVDGAVMSSAEYLDSGETTRVQELVFGLVRVARESPTTRHQNVVKRVARALDDHVEEREVGEIFIAPLDVVLDADRALVVQPDIFFVSHARAHIVEERVYGAPDLVVEVLSPQPRIGDIKERVGWFAAYGVRECWLVHQIQRYVAVLTLTAGRTDEHRVFDEDQRIQSRVLPHFDRSLARMVPRTAGDSYRIS